MVLDEDAERIEVVVPDDQLSLAIGRRGQNVRLASQLTGWDIDILTPTEYNKEVDRVSASITGIDGIDDSFVDKLLALGIIGFHHGTASDAAGPAPIHRD